MKVGILGGGQLSRMLALAGIPKGIHFSFYESQPTHCVGPLGELIAGQYDEATLKAFIKDVDVVTYENENIPVSVIELITQTKPVHPGVEPLSIIQDRLLEKNHLNSVGIPTVAYYPINIKSDISDDISMPFIIKKRRNGYDGKGQFVIKTQTDLESIQDSDCEDAIVEAFIQFDREISLVGCRGTQGEMVFYDIAENYHRDGILRRTENKVDDPCFEAAKAYLEKIMLSLHYVGICTIEFFEKEGSLIANEIAPRVHNSGHWTIEGAVTSQFENHLRGILSLPLGSPESYGDFVMYNLVGSLPDVKDINALKSVHLHDYEKTPRAGRKLGHLTCKRDKVLQQTIEELISI